MDLKFKRILRHSRESGNPGCKHVFKRWFKTWIPAFEGMTTFVVFLTPLHSLNTAGAWTYQEFQTAAQESGRHFRVSQESFEKIQGRKKTVIPRVENYLKNKFKQADPSVIKAFAEVPREYYHYRYSDKEDFANLSYEEKAKPWAIGYGSAL